MILCNSFALKNFCITVEHFFQQKHRDKVNYIRNMYICHKK